MSSDSEKTTTSLESSAKGPAPPSPTEPISQKLNRKQWVQIVSTLVVFTNTWGLLLTFGVFQAYYEQILLKGQSSSKISWISTTCAFFVLATGVVTGPLFDHGYYRPLLVVGSLLEVVGLMVLSLSTEYYQVFLSQALCIGVGGGIIFTPSVAAASAAIPNPKTRARAMGLIASGSSIGGIIYPLSFRYLLPQIGYAWTVRTIGFIVFGLYLISYLSLTYQSKTPAAARRFIDVSAFTDLPFISLAVASVFSATAYYVPFIYLPLLTAIRIPSISQDFTLDLLAILNGASAVGRILAGICAAIIGPTETVCICLVLGSIILFSWIAVDTVAGIVVWVIFWGAVSGVIVALPGAIVPLLCPSLAVIGTRSGMYWVSVGLGLLIGSPIAGAIYDFRTQGPDWWHLQVFAGFFMLGAAAFILHPAIHIRRRSAKTT
ncbi:putative MFS monocarboxylate transporter [Nemania sp. FL0916]|nr:putative MFS monocarboxylate transporter [Nemania sp. FL0916]